MSDPVPTLETQRLQLRSFSMDDLALHHQLIGSDPQVTWHGKALTLEESEAALKKRIHHWEQHGFGMWAVEEKATGSLLGHAGLQMLEDTDQVELGYYFGRPAWGRGVATEAGTACLRYGFESLNLDHVMAVVRPENLASQNVLSKLGFRHSHVAHHYDFDVQVWRLDRNDFKPNDTYYRQR